MISEIGLGIIWAIAGFFIGALFIGTILLILGLGETGIIIGAVLGIIGGFGIGVTQAQESKKEKIIKDHQFQEAMDGNKYKFN